MLKPSHLSVIAPWIQTASGQLKRDMALLGKIIASGGEVSDDPRKQVEAANQKVMTNAWGRDRLAATVSCTADRAQVELTRVRSGSDITDLSLEAKRRWFASYATVPSVGSVGDYYRLRDAPLLTDSMTRALTDPARRALQKWQVAGPEKEPETAAQIVRALRSLNAAIVALPTYWEHSLGQSPGSKGCTDSLFEFSKVVPKGNRILRPMETQRVMAHSSSAPALYKRIIDTEELDAIKKPGGVVVGLLDVAPLAYLKTQHKAHTSQVIPAGGVSEWKTSSMTVGPQ